MKYLKLLIILFALFILFGSLSGVNAEATAANLDIVITNQNPYPAEPGKNVNIEIEIQNSGYENAENKIIEIILEEPFKLLPGESITKTFNIPAKGSVKTSYNLHVDRSAITNEYSLDFKIYFKSNESGYVIESVSVDVQGVADLVLDNLKLIPQNVEPGGIFDILFTVKNTGTGTANNLRFELNSTDELIPVLSGGLVYLGDLKPNETDVGSLKVSVDSSAEQKTYTMTLNAIYKDEENTQTTKEFKIGIPVSGSILLDIIKVESDYSRNIIKVEVANKGTSEAKSLEAQLLINDKLVDVDYKSNLKASKQTTFNFPLVFDGFNGTGKFVINYIGPGLEKNTLEKDIVLNFKTPQGNNSGVYIILVIIVIIIIYLLYRKFRKKKK